MIKPHILFITNAGYVKLAKKCISSFGTHNPGYDVTVVAIDCNEEKCAELRTAARAFNDVTIVHDKQNGVQANATSNKAHYAAACRPWHMIDCMKRDDVSAVLYFDVDYEFYGSIEGLVQDGQEVDWMLRSNIVVKEEDATPEEVARNWTYKGGGLLSDVWRGKGFLALNSGLIWARNTPYNREKVLPDVCDYITKGKWHWLTDQNGLRAVLQKHLDNVSWRPIDRKHYPSFHHFKGPSKQKGR